MCSTASNQNPHRLLNRVRHEIRHQHYSLSTEKSYLHEVRFFVKFHGLKHPRELGVAEVELLALTAVILRGERG